MNLNGTEYFYVRNAQSDIIGLVDKNGTSVASYVYDTWGKLVLIKDGSNNVVTNVTTSVGYKNPYRYRGYRYDTESGLYYCNSRYYNPDWGRFINADVLAGKVGVLLSHNLFAYCMNNPVNVVDPSGHNPEDIGDAYRQYCEEYSSDYENSLEKFLQWYDANNPDTFTDDYGNVLYDYWNLTWSDGPISFSIVKDKFGTYYDGVGANAGKAATGITVSFTFGQVEGGFKDTAAAQAFCSGFSVSKSGGCVLGIARTSSNGRFANEAGFFTPQFGKSYMFYTVRPSI